MSKLEAKELVPELRFPEFIVSEGWRRTTFGAEATFINGKAYKQDELLDKGKYRVLRVGNFFTNKEWYYSDLELSNDKYCDNGDLLYAWSASFGPRIWTGEKVIYHYHIWKVIEKEQVSKSFLYVLLEFETEKMKAQSANGLGLLHITKGAIEGWACAFPKLKEQQKIADCLSSMDDLITANTKKLESLKSHKKGLMQKLFPVEGKSVPELRFPEFKNKPNWNRFKLIDVADKNVKWSFIGGPFGSNLKSSDYRKEGIRIIQLQNIGDGQFNEDYKIFTSKEKADELLANNIYPGDIIISKMGDPVGRACFIPATHSRYVMCSDGIRFVVDENRHNKYFLYSLINDSTFRSTVESSATGSTRKRIGLAELKNLPMLLPIKEEQKKIADFLSSMDDLIEAQSEKIETLKVHKKGLMQRLFPAVEGLAS
ncbi:restriction endonuclease subunit S [Vibrio sp. CK2-1]|uniref:restriction endonuclease subunit S n=1 Tax=Vibrio sp. CK2-1 TaxID=2912249 RepID=UPI001F01FF65|nr:restriction endonuclease subunit S [Vibrio sp. CK2-1]MCF7355527.1 restriction endonuclease subunit S [Vibrio sp. CK2-1]